MEEYREICHAPQYLVSNHGNVKSKRYNRPLLGYVNNCGYKRVQIGSSKNRHFVHRLVADAFCEKRIGCDVVNHKDGNKTNNNSENLEWMTRSENDIHAYRNDLRRAAKGEKSHRSKLRNKDVIVIKEMLNKGFNCVTIAECFGVHRKTVNDIKLKKTWV